MMLNLALCASTKLYYAMLYSKSQIVWVRLVIYNLPLSLEVKQILLFTIGLDLVNIHPAF